MNKSSRTNFANLIAYLLFAILVLLIVGLQIIRTSKLPYTTNEEWSIHGISSFEPPSLLTNDNLPLSIWISLFRDASPITRYLSTLLNVLCFSFVFRLGKALWDQKTGLIAIVLLGTLAISQNLSWMVQPYVFLLMAVPGMLLLWLEWLHRPNIKVAALYVGFAVVACYVCAFSFLFVIVQIVFFLLFTFKNREGSWRTLIVFTIAIAGCFPRLLALQNRNLQSGLPFSSWSAIDLLHMPIIVLPLELMQFIMLLALAAITISFGQQPNRKQSIQLRWQASWQITYPVTAILLFPILIIVPSQLPVGTLYAIGILPLLAILGAQALLTLSMPMRVAILIFSAAMAIFYFRNPIPGMAYENIVEQSLGSSADDRLIVAAPYVWQHLPFMDYASERSFHILPESSGSSKLLPIEQTIFQTDSNSTQKLSQFIKQTPEVWLYNETLSDDLLKSFYTVMKGSYDEVALNQRSWYNEQIPNYGELRKYIRKPDELSIMFAFEDQLTLRAWSLQNSVQVLPCEQITLQSWWATTQSTSNSLSMTLVMVNPKDGQGIAHTDGSPTGRETATMKSDEIHVDERSIQVPCDVQPGEYPLLIGIYEFQDQTIHQLTASLADGSPLGSLAYLTTLFVNS